MNRRERREYEKKLRHLEKTNPRGAEMLRQLEWLKAKQEAAMGMAGQVQEGDKVRIDAEAIYADVNSKYLRQDRKEFVEVHKDDVFTVEYDPRYKKPPISLVCLKEDEHDPKWLWHVTDLKKVEDAD